jgi:hypothetical protein
VNQDDETTKGQPNETSNFFGEMLGYILIAAPFIASTAFKFTFGFAQEAGPRYQYLMA